MKIDIQKRNWPDSDQFHLELPEPKAKEYDEYGHYKNSPQFCADTIQEIKQ